MSWEIVTRADRARQLQRSYADRWRRTPYWEKGWLHLGLPPAKETAEKLKELGDDPSPVNPHKPCATLAHQPRTRRAGT